MAQKKKKKQVKFKLNAPKAKNVSVAGDFNGWDTKSHPLRPDKRDGSNEMWQRIVRLEPGAYEYRFIVDDMWYDDPNSLERCANEFGCYNCIIRV
jgi:1,4-alpha-glucan branching enzyme